MKRTPQEVIDATKAMRSEGYTLKEIAARFRTSITTVCKRLGTYVKSPKKAAEKEPKKARSSLKLIRERLPDDFVWDVFMGATDEELARKYKLTPQEANKAAKHERSFKPEVGCATKAKIRRMHDDGCSFEAIAEELGLGVDTVIDSIKPTHTSATAERRHWAESQAIDTSQWGY